MISYDLAKKLKDAGLKKPEKAEGTIIFYPEGVYHHTLSELIEACGEDFYSMEKRGEDFKPQWNAYPRFTTKGVHGDSPEEAVANLWLALNQKNVS